MTKPSFYFSIQLPTRLLFRNGSKKTPSYYKGPQSSAFWSCDRFRLAGPTTLILVRPEEPAYIQPRNKIPIPPGLLHLTTRLP